MIDPLEFLPESESSPQPPLPEYRSASEPEETVMVELPVDILVALSQQVHQSGQTQAQVILAALRSALKVEPVPPPLAPTTPQRNPGQTELPPSSHALDPIVSDPTVSDPTTATALTAPLLAEIEQLKLRLRQLEALIPKVNDLMGKSIAF